MTHQLTAQKLTQLVRDARSLAFRAHAGQYDKAGYPYIEHLERVALAVRDDQIAMAVGWLHDLVEDQPQYRGELAAFPDEIVTRIELLTRRSDVSSADYYASIKADPIALKVKLADVRDNRSEHRLAQLPGDLAERLRKKYETALAVLTS